MDTRRGRNAYLLQHQGFTLIELIVVLAIIALLMALIVPAVQVARNLARTTQCMNNLRQVALAMVDQTETMQRFPAAGLFAAAGPEQYHSWVTELLPRLDQQTVVSGYDFSQPWNSNANRPITQTSLPILVCPDDISVEPGQGNLSYVVNCGFGWTVPVDCAATIHATSPTTATITPLDFNGNGIVCPIDPAVDGREPDIQIFEKLGLFFVENWPAGSGTVRHHRLASLDDGATYTIMLGENIRAGYDPVTQSSWGTPDVRYVGFLCSGTVCRDGRCDADGVNYARANDSVNAPSNLEALNASLNQPEGLAPWPSSLHAGRINFAFCDGRVKPLNPQIDGGVYAALLSPRGTTITGPLAQKLLSDSDF
jgi:prepilin-type N-terminal cleavage/methylation domain-containing protein/prepilin-type processing-associated H-X9-DG protein